MGWDEVSEHRKLTMNDVRCVCCNELLESMEFLAQGRVSAYAVTRDNQCVCFPCIAKAAIKVLGREEQ